MAVDQNWGRRFLMCVNPAEIDTVIGDGENIEVLVCNSNTPTEWRDDDEANAAQESATDVRITTDREGLTELAVERSVFIKASDPADSITEIWTKLTNGLGDEVTPTLAEVTTGAAAFRLIDTSLNFTTLGVVAGDVVFNDTDDTIAEILEVVSTTELRLSADIMTSGETYYIAPAKNKFYVWYDYASAPTIGNGATYGRDNVWTEYLFVHHFNELATGDMIDSTGNGHDASPTNMDASNRVAGINGQGYAQVLNGTSEYLQIAHDADLRTSRNFTMQWRGWTDVTDGLWRSCYNKGTPGQDNHVGAWKAAYNDWHFRSAFVTGDSTTAVVANVYKHLHQISDYADDLEGYLEGALEGALEVGPTTLPAGDPSDNGTDWFIGRRASGGEFWDGRVSEMRMSQEIRALGKIQVDWNTHQNPADLLWSGAPEAGLPGDVKANLRGNFNTRFLGGFQT